MTKLICCFVISAVALFADVTGKWSGTAKGSTPNGDQTVTVTLELKQTGDSITGTVGAGDSGDRVSISDAMMDGDVLKFKVASDEATYDVTVTVKENTMTGEATTSRGDTKLTMKLELKRDS